MNVTARHAAPGGLRLVEEFLRTRNSIVTPGDLDAWFAARGLPPSAGGLEPAVALREALRALAAANNGLPADPAALDHVNGELGRLGVRPALTATGLTWQSGGDPLGAVLAAVAAAFADGTWQRFKACAADDCRYVFYDHTKNRSARWCDVAGCGVNARMRAYRQRRARE